VARLVERADQDGGDVGIVLADEDRGPVRLVRRSGGGVRGLLLGQVEVERGPRARGGAEADLAAHLLHDRLADAEAEAGALAGAVVGAVRLRKLLEDAG